MRCCRTRPSGVRNPQKKSSETATLTRLPSQKREEVLESEGKGGGSRVLGDSACDAVSPFKSIQNPAGPQLSGGPGSFSDGLEATNGQREKIQGEKEVTSPTPRVEVAGVTAFSHPSEGRPLDPKALSPLSVGAGEGGEGSSDFHSALETPPPPSLSPPTPHRPAVTASPQSQQQYQQGFQQTPPPAQVPLWQRVVNCFSSPEGGGFAAAFGLQKANREDSLINAKVGRESHQTSGSLLLSGTGTGQTTQSLTHAAASTSETANRNEEGSPVVPSSLGRDDSVPASASSMEGDSEKKDALEAEANRPAIALSESGNQQIATRHQREVDGSSSAVLSMKPTAADASSPAGSSRDSLALSPETADRRLAESEGGAGGAVNGSMEHCHSSPTRRSSVGGSSKSSLENALSRMQKHLGGFMDDELLFKASALLQCLEQQLEIWKSQIQQQREQLAAARSGEARDSEDEANEAELRRLLEVEALVRQSQDSLRSDQRVVNLRTKMGIVTSFFELFHLEHLVSVCEEARLSFVQSLSLSLNGGGAAASLNQLGSASVQACCSAASAVGRTSSSAIAGSVVGLVEKTAAQLRPSGCCTASASLCVASAEALPISGAGVDTRDANGTGALPERKTSTTRLKIGLRSVGRKMSLTRRSSLTPRRSSVKKVIAFKNNADDEGWVRERGKYLDLSYRVEANATVSFKVRGKLPCPLFQVLSVLNESDLAGNWATGFKSAEKVYEFSRASQLIRQVFEYPVLGSKESIMFSFGINALEECGAVIIFCTSPPEGATEFMGKAIPPKGKVPRIQSANLLWFLYPISEGRQTTMELFASFHHGIKMVPTRFVTFFIKVIIRRTFAEIAKLCQHFDETPYKDRVARNPEFYSWMRDCLDDFVANDGAAPIKQVESLSLCSFDYEKYQD